MSRRKVGKRNEVKIDFANYSYLLNGIAGIGKTTLAYEVSKKLYGENGGLLLTIGQEPKPEHLGGVLADRAKDWDEVKDIVDDLVEYRNEDYKDLKIIAIDTVDELFRLAEEEIVKVYNASVKDIKERVGSIKQAYKGYQAGENKVVELVVNTIFKLRDAEYCLFFIGHTKQKNKKDLVTEIEFEQITSNLEAKYYNAIKDKVNIVACGYIERELNDVKTVQDAFTKKDKKVGKIASERRVIVFRDEEYAIDVKSHFIEIEPKIDFDTDIFIKTILNAIKAQHEIYHGKTTKKEFEEIKEKQIAEVNEENIETSSLDIDTEDTTKNSITEINIEKSKALIKEFTPLYKSANAETKAKVKTILKNNGSTTLDPQLPVQVFVEILALLNVK